ncbi:hypothetical protein LTR84_000377 [Exophiala bonariae]|uniref:Extracellular membrane protein CFEM domain-containing protein n=1 Tax=Exophiala bonariae TaxID=1690606 RepID=A0AAV9NQC0_9EURO|nr:hypothetical protein LTR84_000377 [Exophiala bonariae]
MAGFKVFLLALLFIVGSSVSAASELHVPDWEDLGDCARTCLSNSLHAVLDDPGKNFQNAICAAPFPGAPPCHDFCDDPTYNSSLDRCLKINCPKWVVGEIQLLSNHLICNISERQNVNFNRTTGNWEVHWPKTLNATGTETIVVDTPHKTGFGHPWAFTAARRGVQDGFPGYHFATESTTTQAAQEPASTFASGLNATTSATCRSIATATTFVFITITPVPSTNISATTIVPSTSCSCNSTSTLTTRVFTTVLTTSHPLMSTHVPSHNSTRVSTTHSTATVSLPPLHTETNAAAAVDVAKLMAFGAGGAGLLVLGLL